MRLGKKSESIRRKVHTPLPPQGGVYLVNIFVDLCVFLRSLRRRTLCPSVSVIWALAVSRYLLNNANVPYSKLLLCKNR
jgi:hypothetical protein